MLEQVIIEEDLTIKNINEILIFGFFIDKDFTNGSKGRLLKEALDKYVEDSNNTKNFKIEYKVIFPPESEYLIIEFMTTTSFLNIIKEYGHGENVHNAFHNAKIYYNDEIRENLAIILNRFNK